MALPAKQQRLVDEYLIDLNATQAAIRAGYSKKTASQIADQNLSKLDIKAALEKRMQARIAADPVIDGKVPDPTGGATHYYAAAMMALLVLVAIACFSTWKVQDWRYDKQLAKQARLHQSDLIGISSVAAAQARADQDKRLALEQRLSASEQTHYRAMSDAQRDQGRLRDRLATSDLRLSVLLNATDSGSGCSVPASTEASGVVHGGARARLDPAHAQRIVAITDAGDQGLIALQACQAYVREVSGPK